MFLTTVRWTGGQAAEDGVHRKDLKRLSVQLCYGLVHPVLEKSLGVEGHSAAEHEVDHPSELLGGDGQRLCFAVLAHKLLVKELCFFVLSQE